ncbi:MAG: hypothetical protein ABL977_15135 [Candidatus Eisenbacteria bacterium]
MRTSPHRSLLLARLALTALLALPLGCVNPFKPADPEIGVGGITVEEDFRTPESLLGTIELALSAKANGASAYQNSLADGSNGGLAFLAYHDDAMKKVYTGDIKEPWTLEDEGRVPSSLAAVRSQDEYTFKFIVDNTLLELDDFPTNDADTGLVHRRYQLLAKSPTSGSDTQGEIIMIGYADISLRRDKTTGRWAVFRWVDHLDPAVGALPAADVQRCFSYRRLKSLTGI